ncbi:hypothetical protein [Halopelagius fulvigenes]|uniref:DUF1490 domain-containing protein n=1 Tax=Halopelagius fulvigenes TaxID=1198324 RepID=A0ABD5TVW5_9EURY
MFGAYTIGKKAVKFGYKRYGIPGAVASGGAALAGYVAVRRALKSSTNSKDENVASAIDAGKIKSAVDERGLGAVTDKETLNTAIDEEKLNTPVDMDEVQSSAAEESDEMTDSPDETTDSSGGTTDSTDEMGDEKSAE